MNVQPLPVTPLADDRLKLALQILTDAGHAGLADEVDGEIRRLQAVQRPDEDWPRLNQKRGELIDKHIAGTLDEAEGARLQYLTGYADARVAAVRSRQVERLDTASNEPAGERGWHQDRRRLV